MVTATKDSFANQDLQDLILKERYMGIFVLLVGTAFKDQLLPHHVRMENTTLLKELSQLQTALIVLQAHTV